MTGVQTCALPILYDDKVLITFNYKEGTQTITFEEAAQAASKENGSDLDCFTAPENAVKSKDFMDFLFCKPWLHGFCTVGVIHVRLCRALYCIAISALFCIR